MANSSSTMKRVTTSFQRCIPGFYFQVSVVDELGIPVKFVGVGEGLDDLQPFDAEAFVSAIFS